MGLHKAKGEYSGSINKQRKFLPMLISDSTQSYSLKGDLIVFQILLSTNWQLPVCSQLLAPPLATEMKVILITEVVDSFNCNLPGSSEYILRRHLCPSLCHHSNEIKQFKKLEFPLRNGEGNSWEKENAEARLQPRATLSPRKESHTILEILEH